MSDLLISPNLLTTNQKAPWVRILPGALKFSREKFRINDLLLHLGGRLFRSHFRYKMGTVQNPHLAKSIVSNLRKFKHFVPTSSK
jgi:hypothetical protein